jgi:hypothetical protein
VIDVIPQRPCHLCGVLGYDSAELTPCVMACEACGKPTCDACCEPTGGMCKACFEAGPQ